MITDEIREELFRQQDEDYRIFQSRLTPTVDCDFFIGVRTPALRKMARQFAGREDIDVFLTDIPHRYFDENQLHAFIIAGIKDYGRCLKAVEAFLPYIDNWATCDQMSPKVFGKHKAELLEEIKRWMASQETYTVRFGIKLLMQHYLDEEFDHSFPQLVADIRSEEYYVRMMVAWYFATALAKQYDVAVSFLEERRLDNWTHNKTIQKAVESYRISQSQKEYLRSLKIKK